MSRPRSNHLLPRQYLIQQKQQPLHPIRQPHQQPYRQQPPIRPQPQPPRPPQFPPWNPQGHQGIPFHCIPPGAFYVPRQPLKPNIHKPIWAVNNKTTHFRYDASFVSFAQTFKAQGFDNLAINTLSAITLDIESELIHFLLSLWISKVTTNKLVMTSYRPFVYGTKQSISCDKFHLQRRNSRYS